MKLFGGSSLKEIDVRSMIDLSCSCFVVLLLSKCLSYCFLRFLVCLLRSISLNLHQVRCQSTLYFHYQGLVYSWNWNAMAHLTLTLLLNSSLLLSSVSENDMALVPSDLISFLDWRVSLFEYVECQNPRCYSSGYFSAILREKWSPLYSHDPQLHHCFGLLLSCVDAGCIGPQSFLDLWRFCIYSICSFWKSPWLMDELDLAEPTSVMACET